MNYVILNGKKSTLIKGLMIQSLPPITKPSIRTKVETIDGRDGDIVTKLGYAAYDKPMPIGLFGDYDIDEVVEYFNTEGVVIFSNEPDKFYKYQILQPINFERLIRFKTATVVFHVQPFKFSTMSETLTAKKDMMLIYDKTDTAFGITAKKISDNQINVKGTSTGEVSFYFPIKPLTNTSASRVNVDLKAYAESVTISGADGSHVDVRVFHDNPTNENSFGGQAYNLASPASYQGRIDETLNYIQITLDGGYTYNLNITVKMEDTSWNSYVVTNLGNVASRPKYTFKGNGNSYIPEGLALDITISFYENPIFSVSYPQPTLPSDPTSITIDTESLDAYGFNPTTGEKVLLNRYVSGDFDDLLLSPGEHQISWYPMGEVTELTIENSSRWL
jgi:phage-related protein